MDQANYDYRLHLQRSGTNWPDASGDPRGYVHRSGRLWRRGSDYRLSFRQSQQFRLALSFYQQQCQRLSLSVSLAQQ